MQTGLPFLLCSAWAACLPPASRFWRPSIWFARRRGDGSFGAMSPANAVFRARRRMAITWSVCGAQTRATSLRVSASPREPFPVFRPIGRRFGGSSICSREGAKARREVGRAALPVIAHVFREWLRRLCDRERSSRIAETEHLRAFAPSREHIVFTRYRGEPYPVTGPFSARATASQSGTSASPSASTRRCSTIRPSSG